MAVLGVDAVRRKKQILNTYLFLMKYLEEYGVDKYNVKNDLIVLSLLTDIMETDMIMSKCDMIKLYGTAKCIINGNPFIRYCRSEERKKCVAGDYDDGYDISHDNRTCF